MDGGHCLLERLLRDKNAEPTDMPISLLKSITNHFADAQKIGCGGFAVVYKGLLKNGAIVAVKKLSNSICMDENKYNQEVSCLMRVKHRNVVRFLGYCADTQGKMIDYGGKFVMADIRERLLCFEYVPNGTLKDYITDASNGLEWRKRYRIIKGICEGLHYLHEMRIVHLDLKPANILLDDNMVPKIADFGISRCFDQEQSWAIATKLVGTLGYLAPESYTRKITSKLDMYSLGVIIIEILTGQKGYSSVENVLESWRNRLKTSSAIDTVLEQIRVFFEISIDCMDFNPEKRPTTRRIIELLEQMDRMDDFNETDVQQSNPTTSCIILRNTIETPQVKLEFQEARKRENGGEQGSAPLKLDDAAASKKAPLFSDDEKPPISIAGYAAGSTKGLVTIKPVKYFKDDAALTADTVTAEVEINATSSTTVREGLDLVVVLDVSGSMRWDKIESVKKAVLFVIMKLTPLDRLSIVTFSSDAARLTPLRSMTPAAQSELKALVHGLQAGGGTNIQAGLETALAVIANRVNTKARAANIFLVCDGTQTSGDARMVDPGQVAIYTFGFGRGTDHQLMSDIAKRSHGGTFSSVLDWSKVSLPFSQLLGGLLTEVAQDVELTITPMTEEGHVYTILVAPGTDYKQITDPATGAITIKFGTLFAGEARRVVITLTLKDVSAFSEEYDAPLAEVQHSFTAQGRLRDPRILRHIRILRTPAPSQAPGASSKVPAEIARLQHANAIRQARLLAEHGQLEDARYKLEDAQKALENNVLDGSRKLVNSLRAELQQLIKLMGTEEMFEAQGHPYALASESCHGLQRYAGRGGDEDDVHLFATPRMDTYLEQAKNFEEDPTAPVLTADEDVKQEINCQS